VHGGAARLVVGGGQVVPWDVEREEYHARGER
jgi:hypothetical protein